jgi:hypothetical protein
MSGDSTRKPRSRKAADRQWLFSGNAPDADPSGTLPEIGDPRDPADPPEQGAGNERPQRRPFAG